MIRKIKLNWFKWIDWYWIKDDDKNNILNKLKIQELDVIACNEKNQKSRLDNYKNYSFLVLHFPRFNKLKNIYELNEFNIFLYNDLLITFKDYSIININSIFKKYENLKKINKKKNIKVTTWFILYEITETILDQMFKNINNLTKNIRELEQKVYDWHDWQKLVNEIMNNKRNIIFLKNMFKPQVFVLKQLETRINKLYLWKMEKYYEDLEDKLSQIINDLSELQEYIDSLENTFKSMIDLKTNFVIKVLTVFSASLLPLTVITSFYGMNINLPYSNNIQFILFLLFTALFIMVFIYLILRKTGRF